MRYTEKEVVKETKKKRKIHIERRTYGRERDEKSSDNIHEEQVGLWMRFETKQKMLEDEYVRVNESGA